MDTKEPFFSVILTTYNRAELLKQALNSLKHQTFADCETFIVNDGSTDETCMVFKEFSGQKNWNFIELEKNHGQYYCRNLAVKQSKAKFVTFLDSDDLWLPNRLEEFAKLIEKNPNAGFIFSNGYIMQNDIIVGKFFDKGRKIPTGKLPPYMAISNYWLPYVTTNVAFVRDVIKKTGYFREDMSHLEDMELYVKILKHCEVNYIAEPLSVYRIHSLTKDPASLTLKWEKGIEDFLTALKTASPPPEVERRLKNNVFYNQAVILLKNGFGKEARKYLNQTPLKGAAFVWYILSYIPVPVIKLLQKYYRKLRKIIFELSISAENKSVLKYIEQLQDK